MQRILVSACLLGINCKYDGGNNRCEAVCALLEREDICLIPVCPEQLGGLPTPRDLSELCNSSVINCSGKDVTDSFQRGAEEALKIAQNFGCQCAVLKARSPSCGSGEIYDGAFSHTLKAGDGVTAKLLKAAGIQIFNETEIEKHFDK